MEPPHLTVYSTTVSAIRRTMDVLRTTTTILDSLSVPYDVVDVSVSPPKRKWMTEVSGTRTLPQVFAGDKFLMTGEELLQMNEAGALKEELEKHRFRPQE